MVDLNELDSEAKKHPFLPVLVSALAIGVAYSAIKWIPIGPPSSTSGRLVAIGRGSSGSKSFQPAWATVDLPGRRATLDTYTVLDCRIGDTIPLKRQRYVWGSRFSAAATRCPQRNQPSTVN